MAAYFTLFIVGLLGAIGGGIVAIITWKALGIAAAIPIVFVGFTVAFYAMDRGTDGNY
jgi:Na+/proline symporter